MKSKHKPNIGTELQIFILSGLIAMGLFSELDRLPIFVGLLTLAVLLWSELAFKTATPTAKEIKTTWSRPSKTQTLIGVVILLPALLFWIAQWSAEFPFSGDHDHHVFSALAAVQFWKPLFWLPLAWTAAAFYLIHRPVFRFWSLAAMALLWMISTGFHAPEYFARYPAFGYLLTAPLLALDQVFGYSNMILANQTTQFLALPVWLFALRPWLVGRWPDWRLLLFAVFIYWQKDFVYYQAAAYLEPWSLVFIALAIEMALDESQPRWRPLLMLGVATWFKETSVLLAPFLWVGIYGPALWQKQKGAWKEAVLVGVGSLTPFFVYYAFRREAKVWRATELVDWSQAFSAMRLHEFGYRLIEQWQIAGVVLLAFLLPLWIWWWKTDKSRRFLAVCLMLAGLFPFAFYFVDGISQAYTGYPRFHLPAYVCLAAPWLALDFKGQLKPPHFAALVLFVFGLQGMTLSHFLSAAFGPSPARSFTEHYDSPAYFPIRSMVQKALAANWLHTSDRVLIASPIANMYPQSFAVGYRDLIEKLRFGVTQANSTDACSCSMQNKAILAPLIVTTGLKTGHLRDSRVVSTAQPCIEQIKRSCQNIMEDRLPDGQVVAVLGVGSK
ncbi:MAG: hypothetical protein AB7N80_03220 [Bdellovibrionales bacterium]